MLYNSICRLILYEDEKMACHSELFINIKKEEWSGIVCCVMNEDV